MQINLFSIQSINWQEVNKHFATLADEKENRKDSRGYWINRANGYKGENTRLRNQLIKKGK